MAEPKESDDEIVKLNSTPPEEDEHGAATRIGEDAYARLAKGMLGSPEPPRPDEPPRSFSSRRPGAPPPVPSKPPSWSNVPPSSGSRAPVGSKAPPPALPKLGDADLEEDASSEGGTMLMPQAAQIQLLGHASQAPAPVAPEPPQKSAGRPAFPFPPPPPISEPPPPRAIRADIVVAVGVFFVIVVGALIFLYFRELMKH